MATFGPPPPLTRDDMIALIERNFEPHWVQGLLADPNSLAIVEAMIAVMLRVQEAGDTNFSEGSFILSSLGAAPAVSVVRLQRPSGASVDFEPILRFQDQRGAVWNPIATVNAPASGGVQTVDVPVQTVRKGYFLNTFDPPVFGALDLLPDPNFTILTGPDAATTGRTAYLDQHGAERNLPRAEGEADAEYANRIRFLEDQVSPKAIAKLVAQVMDSFPATRPIADLISIDGLAAAVEPFRDFAQPSQVGLRGTKAAFCDDVIPLPVVGTIPDPGGTFADDPGGHLIRSREDACAAGDIEIPTPVDPAEARRFYDDSDPTFGSFADDPEFGYPDLPAGPGLAGPLASLADELYKKRAGGVKITIYIGEDVTLLRHPKLFSLENAGDWVDQGGLATDGALVGALARYNGDDEYAVSALGTGAGAPTAAGDLRFNLPVISAPQSVTRVILRAQVRRRDAAVGVDPSFQFLLRPSTSGAFVRVGTADTIAHEDFQQKVLVLEENPVMAAAWTLADVAGTFGFGCANVAGVGATEELRVSELILEIVANYG